MAKHILPGLPSGKAHQVTDHRPKRLITLLGEPLAEGQRGVVLSSPVGVAKTGVIGPGFSMREEPYPMLLSGPSQLEVNQSLLLWDRLHVPERAYAFGLPGQLELLKSEGLLREVKVPDDADVPAALGWKYGRHRIDKVWTAVRLALFDELERAEPGRWALGRGPRSSYLPEEELAGRGLLVKLDSFMAIPHAEVPMDEVLRFRERRNAELQQLRSELVQTYAALARSDVDAMVRSDIMERLSKSVEPYTRVAGEATFRKVLSSLASSMGYDFISGATAAVGMFEKTGSIRGSLLAGAAGFSISKGLGLKRAKSANPFEYVGSYRSELPWIDDSEIRFHDGFDMIRPAEAEEPFGPWG